jgi:hypothetical protein
VGQENLFTIFEMAAGEGGIPSNMGGMAESATGLDDYNFTDDFDTGETEYGVDENVLDLSDAEAEGFGIAAGAVGAEDFEFDTSGMDGTPSMENAGADNFDLDLPNDDADLGAVDTLEAKTAGEAIDVDFAGGFDEVEGLGFEADENPAAETQEADSDEISMDADLEPEISLEPELDIDDGPSLELDDEEPSLELSDEPESDIDDGPSLELSDEPSLELSEEPDLEMGETDTLEEEPSLELPDDLDLADEPELMDVSEEPELMDVSDEPELMDDATEEVAEVDDEGGIDFDLDGVDLDAPEEEVAYEVPEAETGDEEASMDFDGLELEMEAPEEPEDEELTK